MFLNFEKFLFIFLFAIRILNVKTSQITLKVKGSGNERIINQDFFDKISQVTVDGQQCNSKTTCNVVGDSVPVVIVFTGGVNTCSGMFKDRTNIITANLNEFDASQVTDMYKMFSNCTSLTTVTFGNMNSQEVIIMERLFEKCSSLKTVDFNKLTLSKVTNINLMFSGCQALSTISFGTDTGALGFMEGLFEGCSGLISADLSHLKTSNVANMAKVFNGCGGLKSIIFGNIDTSKVVTMDEMFNG